MTPGWLIAASAWALFAGWLAYEIFRAPYVDIPAAAPLWLSQIEPSSIQDLEDSEADDFARDLEELRRIRFYSISDWMN